MAFDKVELQIMDKETFGADTNIGSIIFELKNIEKEFGKIPGGKFQWRRIYGAPIDSKNATAKKKMNEDPDTASAWHGRVLVHWQTYEEKYPEFGVAPITDEVQKLADA
jgi:hypothetical protein